MARIFLGFFLVIVGQDYFLVNINLSFLADIAKAIFWPMPIGLFLTNVSYDVFQMTSADVIFWRMSAKFFRPTFRAIFRSVPSRVFSADDN